MPTTVPNQRMVRVHRERVTSDFLGIKNENWQAASRELGAHALRLYLYLAANADNYTFALSPAALTRDIGMPRSTYHDQLRKLVDLGYLVQANGNTYDFYEVPRRSKNSITSDGQNSSNSEQIEPSGDIEINILNNRNNHRKLNFGRIYSKYAKYFNFRNQ